MHSFQKGVKCPVNNKANKTMNDIRYFCTMNNRLGFRTGEKKQKMLYSLQTIALAIIVSTLSKIHYHEVIKTIVSDNEEKNERSQLAS